MIVDFADVDTERLFKGSICHRQWRSFERIATREPDVLHAAIDLGDLRSPPGNGLEKLSGDRAGHWSIRINDQWRICFIWTGKGPSAVQIVDYR